jgi:Tfp pilus assembly protein PilW
MRRTRSHSAGTGGARRAGAAGVTLVELMIASFLGLAVLLAIGATYIGTERSFKVGARKLLAQQEATILSTTISRFARVGADFQIYNVPNRVTLADSGDGLAVLDEGGALLGRIEWDGSQHTLVDAAGNAVTSMRLTSVKFRRDAARPRVILYRYATDDEKGNLVDIESTVSIRN